MRILVCSKRDLSSVVILNDLLERLTQLPAVALSLMLAERTRPVETIVPELLGFFRNDGSVEELKTALADLLAKLEEAVG